MSYAFIYPITVPFGVHRRRGIADRTRTSTCTLSPRQTALSSEPASQHIASLVTPSDLCKSLASPSPPRIIDVRGVVRKVAPPDPSGHQLVEYVAPTAEYAAAHIPTAAFVDWRNICTYPIPRAIRALSALSVSPANPVVIYDGGAMLFATRVWFSLLAAGCDPCGVQVLQGGWSAWSASGGAVESGETSSFPYVALEPDGAADDLARESALMKEDVLSALSSADADGSPLLIDARSDSQYSGLRRRARRGGHIPGDEELEKKLREYGVLGRGRKVAAYCNGGVASTAVLFALARCGVPWNELVQYDGSWNEWGNLDETYPVST